MHIGDSLSKDYVCGANIQRNDDISKAYQREGALVCKGRQNATSDHLNI